MAASILNVRDLHFYLFELFDAQALTARPRYAEHSKETYLAAIETGRKEGSTSSLKKLAAALGCELGNLA